MDTEIKELLEQIIEGQQEIQDRLDRLEEAVLNISTPGGNYSVFEVDE